MATKKAPKYRVNHPRHSGGPTFTSLTEALRYIAHCIQNGNEYMTIIKL